MFTAWRIHVIACACCDAVSDAFSRTWISAEFRVGNRYANRDFGWFTPRVWSNTISGMNCGSSIFGWPLMPEFRYICRS